MAEPLTAEQIEKALSSLPNWEYEEEKLKRAYSLNGFKEAMAFITLISFEAEDQVHHPEIFNVYSTVNISLSTHDAGDSVTRKDVKLAKSIEAAYNKIKN